MTQKLRNDKSAEKASTITEKFTVISPFRYSGRTEFQNTVTSRSRRVVQFERRPSQRYARRQSHVIREKERERKRKEVEVKVASKVEVNSPEKPPENLMETEVEVKKAEATGVNAPENRLDDLIKVKTIEIYCF